MRTEAEKGTRFGGVPRELKVMAKESNGGQSFYLAKLGLLKILMAVRALICRVGPDFGFIGA